MPKRITSPHAQSGFGAGLIIALIFLIGLATMIMGRQVDNTVTVQELRSDTIERLQTIELALKAYADNNAGNLPCPAPRNVLETAPSAGLSEEFTAGSPNVSCTGSGTGTDQIDSSAGASTQLRVGAVPTATLGLPDYLALDFWGNRITYVIIEDFGDDRASFSATDPDKFIQILGDATDTSALHPEVSASSDPEVGYLLLSHGQNGVGARTSSGGTVPGCAAARTQEFENCDDDFRFVKREHIASNTSQATYFDDVLLWGTVSP